MYNMAADLRASTLTARLLGPSRHPRVYACRGKGVYVVDRRCTLQPWTRMCNPVLHLNAGR